MISIQPTSSRYLLPTSLEDLHHRTREWQSCLEFWKRELDFFRKLIDRYGKQLKYRHNIEEREHLRQLLSYYSGPMMDSLTDSIHHHEARLKPILKNEGIQDEAMFREEHDTMEQTILTIEHEIKAYRNELYILIEKVLHHNN